MTFSLQINKIPEFYMIFARKMPEFYKIGRDFWQLSTSIANISGTDRYIANQKSILSTTTPSTLGEKNLVNFGPQTKTF